MSPSRRVVLTFLSLAVSTGVGTARAEPPGPGPVSASTERSYAGQTILVDAIGASLFGGGLLLAAEDSGASVALSLLGLGTYALGAPIVHGAHDRWGAATGSFFLRILVVPVAGLAGGAVGAKACPSGSEGEDTGIGIARGVGCFVRGAAVGGLLGMVAVSAVDATLLANEPTAPASPPSPRTLVVDARSRAPRRGPRARPHVLSVRAEARLRSRRGRRAPCCVSRRPPPADRSPRRSRRRR